MLETYVGLGVIRMTRSVRSVSIMKNIPEKKYCDACGKRLIKIKTNITYDTHTGEKKEHFYERCPSWWCDFFRRGAGDGISG